MICKSFNPNGVGVNNGHFIGLPFNEEDAKIVILSVPWDVTVSYNDGTSNAPKAVLEESLQLDLFDPEIKDAWRLGIFLRPEDEKWAERNKLFRAKSSEYIHFIENGGKIEESEEMQADLSRINNVCEQLHKTIYQEAKNLIESGKIPAVLGGEHSTPLGLIKALYEKHGQFGVLHIDAHMDLRNAYEGFTYSHASIFHNVIENKYVDKLVQVGIRDNCEEEVIFAAKNNVSVFYDIDIKANAFEGVNWKLQCQQIIEKLPQKVYVSFDIDGLNPQLCPNTGTPVPGGLEYNEATYLIKELVKSGRQIIGFDLCEVAGNNEWDANVGARLLYFLSNWCGRSNGLI